MFRPDVSTTHNSTPPQPERERRPRGIRGRIQTMLIFRRRWRDYSMRGRLTVLTLALGILAIVLDVALVGLLTTRYVVDAQGTAIARQVAGLGRCCTGTGGPLLTRSQAELNRALEVSLDETPGRRAIVVAQSGRVLYASPMPSALRQTLRAYLRADMAAPFPAPGTTPSWFRIDGQIAAEVRVRSYTPATLFGVRVNAKQSVVALLITEPESLAQAQAWNASVPVALASVGVILLAMLGVVTAIRSIAHPPRALTPMPMARSTATATASRTVATTTASHTAEASPAHISGRPAPAQPAPTQPPALSPDEAVRPRDEAEHGVFVSIAQELAPPPTAIRDRGDAPNAGAIDDEATRDNLLLAIDDEAARLRRFADDLLDLSRLGAGDAAARSEQMDVDDMLARLHARMCPVAERAGVTLQAQAAPGLPALRTDPALLEVALVALLHHAIRHTPAGGAVSMRAYQAGPHFCFSVTDTGQDLSAEELARIWHTDGGDAPYNHHDGEIGPSPGLPLARSAITLLGGHIAAQSTHGPRTTVTMRLPLSPSG